MSQATEGTGGASGADAMMGMQAMYDLAAPQERYLELLAQGGYLEAMEGLGLSFNRANTEYVLRHADEFSSRVEMSLGNVRPLIPLNVDPPQHSKYRKLLDPLFAPKRMDEQEEDITRRVNGFIDTFIDRGECNFTEEFAELFPSSVFLGLMGLPEAEMRMFLDLRDGILHPEKYDPDALVDMDARTKVMNATGEKIYEYFGNLVDERTKQPADDIITRFVAAEIDGDKLTRDDILDICFLFLIAGLDTVSASLDCIFGHLAQHPETRRHLVERPDGIPQAVEEFLRWETPVMAVARIATRDTEIAGCPVHEGDQILALIGAANVDDSEFVDADHLDLDRQANRHIAFGGGFHRCLGSHLARLELRVALREWHRRIRDYRLTPGAELNYTPGIRSVDSFPMLLE